jgi:hypothetical protein
MRDHGLCTRERRLVSAHHHGEDALLGARLATRYRRIEREKTTLARFAIDLHGECCGRGRVVNEHSSTAHAMERPISAARDGTHVVIVAHTRKYDFRTGGGFARSRRRSSAVSSDPGLRFGASAVVYDDFVSGACKMACHGRTHDAQTDKSKLHDRQVPYRTDDFACFTAASAL